jgi:hypothetical protein
LRNRREADCRKYPTLAELAKRFRETSKSRDETDGTCRQRKTVGAAMPVGGIVKSKKAEYFAAELSQVNDICAVPARDSYSQLPMRMNGAQ